MRSLAKADKEAAGSGRERNFASRYQQAAQIFQISGGFERSGRGAHFVTGAVGYHECDCISDQAGL